MPNSKTKKTKTELEIKFKFKCFWCGEIFWIRLVDGMTFKEPVYCYNCGNTTNMHGEDVCE